MASISLERAVRAYPDPKYFLLLHADKRLHGTSISEIMCEAIKKHYDGLPPDKKARLLNESAKISKNSY